jgi:hypothetical protein
VLKRIFGLKEEDIKIKWRTLDNLYSLPDILILG